MSDQELELQAWIEDIDKFVVNDIRKALEQDILETSLIILGIIGIDTLGGYYEGTPASTHSFVVFIEEYFPKRYSPFAKLIFKCIRTGLLHDHIIKKYGSLGTVFIFNRDL